MIVASKQSFLNNDSVSSKPRFFKFTVNKSFEGTSSIFQISRLEFIDSSGSYFNYPSGVKGMYYYDGVYKGTVTSAGGENMLRILDHSVYTKLFDGNGGLNKEYIYDLGENSFIDLKIYTRWQWYNANDTSSCSTRRPKEFSISFSDDGENFVYFDYQQNYTPITTNYALAYTGNLIKI